ncbi:bicyclomycin resistance protein [Youhaiella tibetensis]|uniref:Sugar ABC transporter permease n=1 Tax=Paradevosia tibetensis TaxID=1447062 RepID=A0A5B9DL65_9HYPH|nr:sugar ABC transporter permease [Youhaiella tibetensis]AKR54942.1 N-Acetyl-D-glucosamine ABC transport system, permease protein 1 [Devosia sp. H5989]QEE20051.1 sugar ABC transporter permease [Youhaiella tibetensis]GGF27572.1 bicyclomycin resistance protein [Youhaiella tibetensis]
MLTRKRWIFAMLAILPTLAIFAWVRMYPIADTLRLSLHKWDILSKKKPFIGLANFQELMGDRLFQEALLNTTIIAFGVLIITIPSAMVIAALIFHRTRSRFAGFYETAVFIPHVVSLVPAAMAWKWIFDARLGPLNAFLGLFGIQPQAWLFDPVLSVVCVIVLCSWQALGYAVLIYIVGFKSLPVSLYEAAKLDGASGPQSFWFLSIPMLKPITLYVSVVTLVSGFNVYAQAFVLASDAQGAPGRQVRVLVLDMLENSFRNYRVGYAASEAVVLLAIVLVLTLIQFTLLREKGGRS